MNLLKSGRRPVSSHSKPEQGSALIVVIMTLAVLIVVAATLLSYTTSKQAAPFQAASWQEAGTAAEGGVELALSALRRSIEEGTGAWGGWEPPPSGSTIFKKYLTDGALLSHEGEGNTDVRAVVEVSLPTGTNTINPPDALGNPVSPSRQAYLIRSTGIANVPGPARLPLAKPDQALRKLNFISDFRTRDKVTNGKPQVARVIEAVASPVTPFQLAIHAKEQLDMKGGAVAVPNPPPAPLSNLNQDTMRVDSYDPSRKPVHPRSAQPNDGAWKTDYEPEQFANGSIASNGKKKDTIRLEKVAVLGNVARWNVESLNFRSPGAVISGLTIDGFYRELKPVPYPGTRTPAFAPIATSPTGKAADRPHDPNKTCIIQAGRGPTGGEPNPPPAYYKLDKIHLHDGERILIKKDSNPGGTAEIWVTGDIVLHKGGRIEIEDTAKAVIYCEKNVTIEEKDETHPAIMNWAYKNVVSTNETNVTYKTPDPESLQFYGCLPRNQKPHHKHFKIKGNMIGLVYAPYHEFEVKLKKGGDRAIWGSLVGRKFNIQAGTRVHYDESLAEAGKPFDYTLESWQEDWFDPEWRNPAAK